MITVQLTEDVARECLAALEDRSAQLRRTIHELRVQMEDSTQVVPEAVRPQPPAPPEIKPKRVISAAGRKAMREGQKKRWAKIRSAKADRQKITAVPKKTKAS
jgi:hypothetical protein